MEAEVLYYCEDYDGVDIAMLSKHFGEPEDVARDFLSELGESTLIRSDSVKYKLRNIVIAVVIAASFVVVGWRIYISYKQQQLLDGYFVESITYEGDVNSYITTPTYIVEYEYHEDELK